VSYQNSQQTQPFVQTPGLPAQKTLPLPVPELVWTLLPATVGTSMALTTDTLPRTGAPAHRRTGASGDPGAWVIAERRVPALV
jgi:hypothetical protein